MEVMLKPGMGKIFVKLRRPERTLITNYYLQSTLNKIDTVSHYIFGYWYLSYHHQKKLIMNF